MYCHPLVSSDRFVAHSNCPPRDWVRAQRGEVDQGHDVNPPGWAGATDIGPRKEAWGFRRIHSACTFSWMAESNLVHLMT